MAVSAASSETLSPELVLVDPRLSADARACLADPDDTLTQLGPTHVTSAEQETAAALRRISQIAELEEFPERTPRWRGLKLAGALATWATFAVLVADTQLWSSAPL
jgi:hypothetical protein